ncbi:MAG: hypothetical protein ACK5NG_03990 [Chthoniobacterales bacterium]
MLSRLLPILKRFADGLAAIASARVQSNVYIAATYSLATILSLLIFLLVGLRLVEQTNQDSLGSDQGAYIRLAQEQQAAWYPFATDGSRNGFISWITAKISDPTSDTFFISAKRTNIAVAALITLGMAIYFGLQLPALTAWNLTILSGFGALLGIGSFFGGEVLLYGSFFGFWVSAIRFLQKPAVTPALFTAFFAAASYLAKPSVGPALQMLFVFCIAIIFLAFFPGWSRRFFNPKDWFYKKSLAPLLVLFVLFFVLTAPRAWDSWKKFDTPFYNIGKYTFWLDDWDSGYHYLGLFRKDRIMEVDESIRPTPQSYFARNGFSGAWKRLQTGVSTRLQQFFLPEKKVKLFAPERKGEHRVLLTHRGFYISLLFCTLLALGASGIIFKTLPAVSIWCTPALYAGGCFFAYLLAFGWFLPVGPGHRFMMMFYIPLAWTAVVASDMVARSFNKKEPLALLALTQLFITMLLVSRLWVLRMTPQFGEIRFTF